MTWRLPAVLDLRDDGTIGIDFEDGQTTVVLARPKFGAYKRVRAEAARISAASAAFIEQIDKQDPPLEMADRNAQVQEHSDDLCVGWWSLILVGDDTFKPLVSEGTVPSDPDDWPAYLIYGTNIIAQVLAHWRNVPLASGGTPVQMGTPTA